MLGMHMVWSALSTFLGGTELDLAGSVASAECRELSFPF